MLQVLLDKGKVTHNFETTRRHLKRHDCHLTVVTKVFCLTPDILAGLPIPQGIEIYDTKTENIETLQRAGHTLMVDAKDFTGHAAERSVIVSDFSELPRIQPNREIVLNFDCGDGRGGFPPQRLDELIRLLNTIGRQNIRVMSNIGCLKANGPSARYFDTLGKVVRELDRAGLTVARVSMGGSNCLPYLASVRKRFAHPVELRVGEAIFMGKVPGNKTFDSIGLRPGTAFLQCPASKIGHETYLASFGYIHITRGDIDPRFGNILKQSSECSILKTKKPLHNGNLALPLEYRGLAKLSNNRGLTASNTRLF